VIVGPVGGQGVFDKSASILCPKASKSIMANALFEAVDFDRISINLVKQEYCIAGRWSGVAADLARVLAAFFAKERREGRSGSR